MASSVYRSAGSAEAAATRDVAAAAAAATRATNAIKTPDLCVLGAGAGGLTVAAAAAALGVSVVLIEKHKMGGDCLNAGCIPSKALIAAATRAQAMRTAAEFGLNSVEPKVDLRRVLATVHDAVERVAENDAAERFEALGVDVVRAAGRFVDKRTVEAGDVLVRARRFVVATGSSPAVPATPGLASIPYLTNETLFNSDQPIGHLIVVGGGPQGIELAQAYRRLGARVTVLEQGRALARIDAELSAVALRQVRRDGVTIEEDASIDRVGGRAGAVEVQYTRGGTTAIASGSHLLVATGRKPNIERLGLDIAGVGLEQGRIRVNAAMRTSNRRIFAIGAVTGGEHTHVANAQAEIVIRRALFRQPVRIEPERLPRVVFTDPAIACVGATENEARSAAGKISIYRWPFAANDKAVLAHDGRGLIKVVCDRNGKILGAGIAGVEAGELIQIWSLAISQGLSIDAMTQWTAPYPTLGEISKRVAMVARAEQARRPIVRKMLTLLRKLG